MNKITIRSVFRVTTVVLSMLFLASCSSMPASKSVDIEGRAVSYVFSDNSGPTVVFDAGGGRGLDDCKRVFNDVAENTAVVAYTRSRKAAAGDSRTGEDAAYTLKALLEKIEAPKPYVLVGHSLGGMYVRCFAKMFPEDVAGVVLLDSIPKGFISEARRLGIEIIPTNIKPFPAYMQAEFRGIEETDEQLPTPTELGDMPITLILATKREKGYEKLQAPWLRFQEEFIEGLPNGRLVVAHGSGHDLQLEAPKIVLREIQLMVAKTVAE